MEGIKSKNKTEKYNKIFEKKLCSSFSSLFDKLPNEFINFVQYIKDLDFEDKPNYQYLKSLLGKMYDKNYFNYDIIFDFSDNFIKKEKMKKNLKLSQIYLLLIMRLISKMK